MKKLVPQTPDALAHGSVASSLLTAVGQKNFVHILEKHNITTVEPDGWYSHALLLDVLRDIRDNKTAMYDLMSIGMQLVDRDAPLVFPTLENVLFAVPQIDATQHRNSPGSYIVTRIDERCIQLKDYTPWPHDLVYGLLWEIIRKYEDTVEGTPSIKRVGVEYDATHGDEIGIYEVRW
ncbi:MAG: hypothetical protein GYB65_10395 [Chloroflexi bacterium]|nr:hypothetical protein [Chloroflexota bacterium]